MAEGRLNPTLFDKLVAGNEVSGMRGSELDAVENRRNSMNYFSVTQVERFNESALRATVRRDLAWLLNTTDFASAVDIESFPEVRTSVLNFGVPDLAGKSLSRPLLLQRAREIRAAIRAFEPRISDDSLRVDIADNFDRENSVTFTVEGDISSAVRAIPVKFYTDVENDTAAVTVRE
jgi:type VI secretion system protein ImpF